MRTYFNNVHTAEEAKELYRTGLRRQRRRIRSNAK